MGKKNFLTVISIAGITLILSLFGMRICPFFRLFKFPCPGCGLTRATKAFLTGHLTESIDYNPLACILFFTFTFYFLMVLFGNKKRTDAFLQKNKKMVYVIALLLTISIWIINIKNSLLY